MSIVYFDNAYPVAVLEFESTVYYFKVKHLAKAIKTPCSVILNKIPPRYVQSYETLIKQYFPSKKRFHPCTLFVKLEGVKYILEECCANQFYKDCLDEFVRRNVTVPAYKRLTSDYTFVDSENADNTESDQMDDEEELDYAAPKIRIGTLKYNVRFVAVVYPKKRWYYKASDVVFESGATSTYNLTKHVADKNMVVWRDLKNYLENTYRCRVDSEWKPNAIFLKQAGLKQLLFARKQQVLYSALCLSAMNYDFENPVEYVKRKPTKPGRHKQLFADECKVGKLYKRLDYIKLPNGKTYFKFCQVVSYYKLKNVDRKLYKTIRWADVYEDLQKNNIKWRLYTHMIEAAEVYRLLQQYGLSVEADKIYFKPKTVA